ncbi:hypothetical protein [Priestia abyssalis]|nr:hypothetical protein [Priestia abyssalis]
MNILVTAAIASHLCEKLTGKKVNIHYSAKVSGEPKHTWADYPRPWIASL